MYKRDLITSEIQKMVEVLARIMGLKHSGKQEEADALFMQTLEEKFGITNKLLNDTDHFMESIASQNMSVEKLDMLTQFLFNKLNPADDHLQNSMIAGRLMQLYSFLEFEHHTISLENMDRQQIVKKYL